jgi:hypothetical protein
VLDYNAPVPYDCPDYTYDGEYVGELPDLKEALFRELRAVLPGVTVALDEMPTPARGVVFKRITAPENSRVRFAAERFEFELIGPGMDATADVILAAFSGLRRLGQYSGDGEARPGGGRRVRGFHAGTRDGYETRTGEDLTVISFRFSHVR